MVREACCEDESPIVKESSVTVDPETAVVGARLALRLIAKLGGRYVGEARRFHTVDWEAE